MYRDSGRDRWSIPPRLRFHHFAWSFRSETKLRGRQLVPSSSRFCCGMPKEEHMKPYILLIAPALVLGACQGPAETAGAEKDKAAAEAAGQPYEGEGPNERIGAAKDRAAEA